jgi:hypothetical protein
MLFVFAVLVWLLRNSYERIRYELSIIHMSRRELWKWERLSIEDRRKHPEYKPKQSLGFIYVKTQAVIAARLSSVVILLSLLLSVVRG